MLIVKIVGKKYSKEELQENSIIIRKWFAVRCIENITFDEKYYEINEVSQLEQQ